MKILNAFQKGFTLIELLLVIVILGIVISIAISIINPARIQRRARESVLIAQLSKMCAAIASCASVTGSEDHLLCDQFAPGEIEITSQNLGTNISANNKNIYPEATNQPPYSYYQVGPSPRSSPVRTADTDNILRIQAVLCGNTATTSGFCAGVPAQNGAKDALPCQMYCDYNFTVGTMSAIEKNSRCY